MARVSISQYVREFRDLDLNFGMHPVRKDITKAVDEYAIVNSIKHLVLTNHYERPFQPTIGSNVRRLLFENVDSITAVQLEREIEETIVNFEPRVQVTRVSVQLTEDENRYAAQVEFYIVNQTNPITISFFLERIR